jgi:transcriptional regulator with XRE-family HTH domain
MGYEEIEKLPVADAIRALRNKREWSDRQFSEQVKRIYPDWGSPTLLSDYQTGKLPVSMTAMERLANVFGIEPELFADYRLAVARAQLDPEQVGLKIALKNLDRFDR